MFLRINILFIGIAMIASDHKKETRTFRDLDVYIGIGIGKSAFGSVRAGQTQTRLAQLLKLANVLQFWINQLCILYHLCSESQKGRSD